MTRSFDPLELRAAYDLGRLVPFTGSGMSVPACSTWHGFVGHLEQLAGIAPPSQSAGASGGQLSERALAALRTLRRRGVTLPEAVRRALYEQDGADPPANALALAAMHWPLVCTTNYDEIHLRAVARQARSIGAVGPDAPRIRVLGRSDSHCKQLLQHLALPAEQVLWAMQGFLAPESDDALRAIVAEGGIADLEDELVVGHAEYRRAAHRAPHFRRAFAELFRSRSLLFLGSGLTEAYFRMLFDEIVELGGAPHRPHHAFIEDGSLDPEFMQREYHIRCHVYPAGAHGTVGEWLTALASTLRRDRVRTTAWSYQVAGPGDAMRTRGDADFVVTRGILPTPGELGPAEALGISCGRDYPGGCRTEGDRRGYPGLGYSRARENGIADGPGWYRWIDEAGYVARFTGVDRTYGVVARDFGDEDQAIRSPESIRKAFIALLEHARSAGHRTVHVQLLAAGPERVFAPWVSLTQMACAYGQWHRDARRGTGHVRAVVHVVDERLVALLRGGFLDLTEALEDAPLRLQIETVEPGGERTRHHAHFPAESSLGSVVAAAGAGDLPRVHAIPTPRLGARSRPLAQVRELTLREFGLVTGSTLVVSYDG